jgi:energy-coupling factor transporter transmembrane protein EcfT
VKTVSAFGAYLPGDTLAHRVDARVKLVGLAALSVALFLCSSLPVVALCAACSVGLAMSAGVPVRTVFKSCAPLVVVLAVAFLSNALCSAAEADLVFGIVGVSFGGVARGALFALRVFALVVLTLVVCATTSIRQLSRAFSAFLRPLARFIPADDVAMTLTLAIRFIPVAEEELARVRDAQAARGLVDPDAGLVERLKSWGMAFVPLVVGLFMRADRIASAMRDRCYGARERVWTPCPLDAASRTALVVLLVLSVLIGVV